MEHHEYTVNIGSGTIFRAILIVLFFALMFFLKDLLIVVLMSIVIASAIEPVAKFLTRHKFPRLLAVILVYLFLATVFVSIIYFLLLPLLSESIDLVKNLPTYFSAQNLSNSISHNSFLSSQPFVSAFTNSANIEQVINQINSVIVRLSSGTFNTITTVFGGILSFLLMVFLSFYLSVQEDGVETFLRIIAPLKHEKYVLDLWKRSQHKIGLWMQGQLILAGIIGMLVYLGLLLLGIHNALLLAALAAAFEIIPLFGPILAAIPAVAISLVSGGLSSALLVAGFYLIIHQFENQLIYPLVVKKVVGVPPIVSIIALVAGFELAGFLGLILSVPIASVVIEFFEDLERDKIQKIEHGIKTE